MSLIRIAADIAADIRPILDAFDIAGDVFAGFEIGQKLNQTELLLNMVSPTYPHFGVKTDANQCISM